MTSPSEFTDFQILNFQLLHFSNLLEVVVIRRKKLLGQILTQAVMLIFHYPDRVPQTQFVHGAKIFFPFVPEFSDEFSAPPEYSSSATEI
jgi:hypothetical protein